MSQSKLTKKERAPLIQKRELAFQAFLDDEQVKAAIERIISSTWDQAVNTCAVVLEANGQQRSAVLVRAIRRPG